MMKMAFLLPLTLFFPLLLGAASLFLRSPKASLIFCSIGTVLTAILSGISACWVFRNGPLSAAGGWFYLDAFSAYHLLVMVVVYSLSALYGIGYFGHEIKEHRFTGKTARRYTGLWFGSLGALVLALISNNLGLLWVGIGSTTLLTAFLICLHPTPGALEAMWKYLLMCSVGMAIAFTGTLLVAASAGGTLLKGTDVLLLTELRTVLPSLNPMLLKAGFLFLVVGYGTKAGLAPLHNWLPDAHSQAPAPVSAVFSGFLLSAAGYGIFRCLPLIEGATGNSGWGRGILIAFGLLSLLTAAVFLVGQKDIKRLLAYSSVEHMGIITLGFGLGGIGVWAALLHTLSHSLGKSVSFFCAGRLGQIYGSHEIKKLNGIIKSSPLWGGGLVTGLLALIGVAPFVLFFTEFYLLKAAVDAHKYMVAGLFLFCLCVVFVGISRPLISMAWKPCESEALPAKGSLLTGALVYLPLALLFLLGFWLPSPLNNVILQAAHLLTGVTP